MVVTVDEATRHIMDTLNTDELPRVGAHRILNDAGEFFTTCKPGGWEWLRGRRITLPFENGQGHIWLPRDFRELVAYDASGFTNSFILATDQDIIDIRTKAAAGTNWPYRGVIVFAPKGEFPTGTIRMSGAPADAGEIILDDGINAPIQFEFDTDGDGVSGTNIEIDTSAAAITSIEVAQLLQAAIEDQFTKGNLEINAVLDKTLTTTINLTHRVVGTQGNIAITDSATNAAVTGMSGGLQPGRPQARIDLSSNPTADLEDALTVYYRAGWTHTNEDDDFIAVPEWCETVYLQLVRAHARGYHREDMGSLSARVGEIMAGPHMKAAMEQDDRTQTDFGMQRGGAIGHSAKADIFWNSGSVNAPS